MTDLMQLGQQAKIAQQLALMPTNRKMSYLFKWHKPSKESTSDH